MWTAGICDWEDVLQSGSAAIPLPAARAHTVRRFIDHSLVRVQANDPLFFAQLLPTAQHWRLFPDFRNALAYVDIETTGMGDSQDYITTIALYDGSSVFTYVQGYNLDQFKEDILKYKMIVTYNGKCFDLPFLRNYFRLPLDHAHIDLRFVLKSLGYGGGLKKCERSLGIDREELEGVDGFFAVLLWEDYLANNNQKSLETLLAYNIQDVVNLEALMVMAYNMKLKDTPFLQSRSLDVPPQPTAAYKADIRTIERIRDHWMLRPWH